MSAEVQQAMFDVLKDIQDMAASFDRRFDRLDDILRKQSRDLADMRSIMRRTCRNLDARVTRVAERMDALEGRSG